MAYRRKRGSHTSQQPPLLSIGIFCIILLAIAPASRGYELNHRSNTPDQSVLGNTALQVISQSNNERQKRQPRKIAIIGGGYSSLSLAHFLQRENQLPKDAFEVTVFEQEPQIGGRIRMANAYGNGREVDTGGHTFDTDDELMRELLRTTGIYSRGDRVVYEYPNGGLRTDDYLSNLDRASLWDGQTLTINVADEPPIRWSSLIDILKQDGMKPRFWWNFVRTLRRAMTDESLDDGVDWNFISPQGAEDYKALLIWSAAWARPGPDKRTLRNFAHANSISLKPQNTTEWRNGIVLSRLLDHLNEDERFSLKLNSTVTRITRHLPDPAFHVHGTQDSKIFFSRFDYVVIAAPSSQAQITIIPSVASPPKFVAYTPLHVTQFISRRPMDPRAFNLPPNTKVPRKIWNVGNTTSSFLSITQENSPYREGCVHDYEPIYRVISKEPFSNEDIASLFNKFGKARKCVTFPEQSCTVLTDDSDGTLLDHPGSLQVEEKDGEVVKWSGCVYDPDIRWVHREYWPNGMPVVETSPSWKEEPMELGPRLFYVSGFEGREGASISKSLRSANRVKDMLVSGLAEDYEAI